VCDFFGAHLSRDGGYRRLTFCWSHEAIV